MLYEKIYHYGRLSFKVEVSDSGGIELTRLPIISNKHYADHHPMTRAELEVQKGLIERRLVEIDSALEKRPGDEPSMVYSQEDFGSQRPGHLALVDVELQGSYNDVQMCSIHYKPNFDPAVLGWDGVTKEEGLEQCIENSGHESAHFVVGEYVGREQSSQNLSPDTALDGFMEYEITEALRQLEADTLLLLTLIKSKK